jgi:hypothetical protein
MEKVKRSRKDKEICHRILEYQLLNYVINEEIGKVFEIDKSIVKNTEEQGKINLASLFI